MDPYLLTAMRKYIGILLGLLLLTAGGCCEQPPTYKGAPRTGCSTVGDVTCCTYSDDSCSYILCSDYYWDETSWYCY